MEKTYEKIKKPCIVVFRTLGRFMIIPESVAELCVKEGYIKPTSEEGYFEPIPEKLNLFISI